MIPLALIDAGLRATGWRANPVIEAVGPVVLTAAVVGICLTLHALLVRCGLGVLFDPIQLFDRARSTRLRPSGRSEPESPRPRS